MQIVHAPSSGTLLAGGSIKTDKTGLVTVCLRVLFSDAAEALAFIRKRGDSYNGMERTGCSCPVDGSGLYEVEVTYEGPSEKDPKGSDTQMSIETSSQQPSIQTHPNFAQIAAIGKWDAEKKEFPEFFDAEKLRRNTVWYGVENYLTHGVTFTMSYTTGRVPVGIYEKISYIFKQPPNIKKLGFITPVGRNWLKMPPKVTKKGSAFSIEESYQLSGDNAWNEDIYKNGDREKGPALRDPGGLDDPDGLD